VRDNDAESIRPKDMLAELCNDNRHLAVSLRSANEICARHHDVATTSLIETWIDQTERRTWFLAATVRDL